MPRPPRRPEPDRFAVERDLQARHAGPLAGVDEAGRGPLAGPVVAAAVILPRAWQATGMPAAARDLNDSKQLGAAARERLFAWLTTHPEIHQAVAVVEADLIDALNILQATHRAMRQVLAALGTPNLHALIDGRPVAGLEWPQTALVKGDGRSYSIAAASVLAKVTRDHLMQAWDTRYPGYGFAEHKGYPTPAHLAALRRLGPCPLHRRSFAPVRAHQAELW